MSEKISKTFLTGEFARWFGVSKDTLLYYDKLGLFKPAGVEKNGYRYYDVQQLDLFWIINSLKELKFPLKELKQYIDNPSPEKLIDISQNKLYEVEKEIQKLEKVKWLLNSIVTKTTEACTVEFDKIILSELPDEQILCSEILKSNSDISKEEWFECYDSFLEQTGIKGFAYIGSIIGHYDLLSGKFGTVEKLFVRIEGEGNYIKKGGLYANIYRKGDFMESAETYTSFIKQINEMGLCINGDAFEEYLIDIMAVKNQLDFVTKISIPVSKII